MYLQNLINSKLNKEIVHLFIYQYFLIPVYMYMYTFLFLLQNNENYN